ncbi:uncharacterized protein LOC126322708 [Schistocerca gregaria]|uniref:uncharacterized protein LOC126322708 n=1 Tax=Schistocerca gregaria TaxID=7010 RepID=UPI00211EB4D5|nr:uncharacterized protein LOC126322708 [Schistocerca gregaria]
MESGASSIEESPLVCRMYEEPYPEVDQVVMVKVKQIAEMGAFVTLLEYNNIEGMILLSELSRKRIRSVKREISVNQEQVAVVLRVDKEKGYIDLSKRRVSQEDIKKMGEKYYKSKTVHSIMKHIADTEGVRVEELYKMFGWPLYRTFGHAFDAFKMALQDPDKAFGQHLPKGHLRTVVLKNIERRLTPRPVRIRAEIELTCFSYEGVEMIKEALREGEACGTPEIPISITLLAPPQYLLQSSSLNHEKGIQLLEKAISVIQAKITEHHGKLTVKSSPRSVTEADQEKLQTLMDDLERANQEVDGDYDDSDEESSFEEGVAEE